jgi:hypothetical protein
LDVPFIRKPGDQSLIRLGAERLTKLYHSLPSFPSFLFSYTSHF